MYKEFLFPSPYTAILQKLNGVFTKESFNSNRFLELFIERCKITQKDLTITKSGFLDGVSPVVSVQGAIGRFSQQRGLVIDRILDKQRLIETMQAESSVLFTTSDVQLAMNLGYIPDQRVAVALNRYIAKVNGVLVLPEKTVKPSPYALFMVI